MFVGGLRALVLQSLHPLAMAGVAGHSGYRGDPWGRLQRTSQFLAATTFGSVDVAERAVARVRAVHATSAGPPLTAGPTGRATRICSAGSTSPRSTASCEPTAASAPRPLTPEQRDEYVAEVGFVAAKLGVLDPPQSVAELGEVLAVYRPELRGTREARDTARFLLFNPPIPLLARPAYGLIATAAVSMLPPWARRHAAPASPAADRRRPRRPARRRAGDEGVPLDVDRLVADPATAPTDLTRRKHCGNRRETGPPYGASRAAEPPPTRPPPRR